MSDTIRKTPEYDLAIPESDWVANDGLDDDPEACLHATLVINDALWLHLEAWAVTVVEEPGRGFGIQRAVHDEYEDSLGELHAAVSADGHFDTLTIRGREYVVLASPFC